MKPTAEFKPRRWLSNGHLQTIIGNFLPRRDALPAAATELVKIPLPPEMQAISTLTEEARAQSRLICHCHWQPSPADAPTVVLVHGLEGSSNSQYVIGNANKLWSAGANVIRMNMRNCGSGDVLSPTLYHSGLSCDVLAVLQWCVARGCTQIVLAGYSMGGNLILKAAGELGNDAPVELKAVIAISPPIDLRESADALHQAANRIYERRFLRALKARYRRKSSIYPAIFSLAPLERVQSIRDFDEYVMAPRCGFTGANDYYARSGASLVIDSISVPVLMVHAWDDPFIRLTPETHAKLIAHPLIELEEPQHGGHCAFLAEPNAAIGYDGYWAEHRLRAFVLRHCAVPKGTPQAATVPPHQSETVIVDGAIPEKEIGLHENDRAAQC